MPKPIILTNRCQYHNVEWQFKTHLKWFFSRENSVADFTLDAARRTWPLVDEMVYDVGAWSTPFAVVALLSWPVPEVLVRVRGQVETLGGLEGRKTVAGRRLRGLRATDPHRPQRCSARCPSVHSVNVWWREDGLGRGREHQVPVVPGRRRQVFRVLHFVGYKVLQRRVRQKYVLRLWRQPVSQAGGVSSQFFHFSSKFDQNANETRGTGFRATISYSIVRFEYHLKQSAKILKQFVSLNVFKCPLS